MTRPTKSTARGRGVWLACGVLTLAGRGSGGMGMGMGMGLEWMHACRGSPDQRGIDCCCNCEAIADYEACPPFDRLSPFENLLTGDVTPATWPWISKHPHEKLETLGWEEGGNAVHGGPIFTWILSDGHTGSSALAGLIASSPAVGTLCNADVKNCEGEKVLMQLSRAMPKLTKKQRGQLKRGQHVDINWFRAVREYSRYWNQSKPVLLDKSPAFLRQGPMIAKQLREHGLRTAFIVMSHSCCTTSTRPGESIPGERGAFRRLKHPNVGLYNWNRTNTHLLEVIDALIAAGENVLHVRYEAMVTDPVRFGETLIKFLPELGTIDPHVNGIAESTDGGRAESIAWYVEQHPVTQNTCERFPRSWVPQMTRLGYFLDSNRVQL